MMVSYAVRAARPPVARSVPPTWIPAGQAMSSTECQLQISVGLAIFHLTAHRRLSRPPRDALAARVRRRDLHRAARESIAKDVAHVVPDLVGVEVVCEDGLADIGFEDAVFDRADLQRNAAGDGIATEGLAVGSVFGNGVLGADAAADGPQVDGLVALVCDDCAADGLCAGCEGEGSDSESGEQHDRQL